MTTVQLKPETKQKLDDLKIHPRETYDELINRLADAAYDDEKLSEDELVAIKESENDINAGRVRSLREIMKPLGDDAVLRSLVD